MGVDRITQGPLNGTGIDAQDSPGSLLADVVNGVLSLVTNARLTQALKTTLYVWQQQAALATITTAQTLLSLAVGAGAANTPNRKIRLEGWLNYSSSTGNVATITLAMTLGGVTICSITTAATNTTASVNLPVKFRFDLTVPAGNAAGSVSAVIGKGEVKANIGTSAAAAIAIYLDTNVPADTITIGTNPAAGDYITVNGTKVTFVVHGGTAVGNQVVLNTTAAGTATDLYTFLAASVDANIAKTTWTNPSSGVVLGVPIAAGFVTWVSTSVPAKITFSTPTVDLTAAKTLALTIAASGSGLPSAQLQYADLSLDA